MGATRRLSLGIVAGLCVLLSLLDTPSLVPAVDRRRAGPSSDGLPVPSIVHYVELSPPSAPFAFSLLHYLSLLGVLVRVQPAEVRWHHRAEPVGEW